MFRKSLYFLVAASLLSLGAIVAYATLHVAGADEALDKAEQLHKRGESLAAVSELSYAERSYSVQRDRTRQQRLWRLRYQANTKLENWREALQDVDKLIADGIDEIPIRLDQVSLMARNGEGDAARLAAQRFLGDHPGHDRGLELAGEACQTMYQPQIKAKNEEFDRDLGRGERRRARELMLAFVYRSDGDPEAARAAAELRRVYTADPRRAAGWEKLWTDLQAIRKRVQEGLGYFRQSLEAGGRPVAAFRAVALALDQSGRTDDLLMACEIHRRRFDHAYVVEAGSFAAWKLLREQQDRAALATIERWLPAGTVQQRIRDNNVSPLTGDLVMARAYAAWRLADATQLQRALGEGWDLAKIKMSAYSELFAYAISTAQNGNRTDVDKNLRWACGELMKRRTPIGQIDVTGIVNQLWQEALRERNASPEEQQDPIAQWIAAREEDIEPRLAMADFLLGRGRTAAGLQALETAAAMQPDDPRPFARRIEASRAHFRDSGEDGPGLLLQCQKRQSDVPEVKDPIGYLLCAEEALRQKQWRIARQSARAAVDAFPTRRQPRVLEVQASLADERPEEAARQAGRLLEILTPDQESTQLALRAYRGANLDTTELLFRAMPAGRPDPLLAAELLRHSMAAGPAITDTFVTGLVASPEATMELRNLAARVLIKAGRVPEAETLLNELLNNLAQLAGPLRAELVETYAAWLPVAARSRSDADLTTFIESWQARFGTLPAAGAKALANATASLADTHPRAAFATLTAAIDNVDADDRNGTLYALAGRLALRDGDPQAAIDNWTAAVGFAEGRSAAEDLARLHVWNRRLAEAKSALELAAAPSDPALLLRCGRLPEAAERLGKALEADSADLLAHCLLALTGRASGCDWPAFEGAAAEERLEVLAALQEPALAQLVLPRLQAMQAAAPTSRTNRLLLARALAWAGQGEQAAMLHLQLHQEQAEIDPLLWREVALLSKVAGYVADAGLRESIMRSCADGKVTGSMVTIAYGLNSMADSLVAGGYNEMAEKLRLKVWLDVPQAQPLGAGDLDRIVSEQSPIESWHVLDQVLQGPFGQGRERPTRIDRLHKLARAAVNADPATVPVLRAAALRYLASDGARGAIVHFLRDTATTGPLPGLDEKLRTEILWQHLRFVAAGGEAATDLDRTLDLLRVERSLDAVVDELQRLLRAHPTTLALWYHKARLLAESPEGVQALRDLRLVLRHANAPELVVRFVALAAAARQLEGEDLGDFGMVPGWLHATPDGVFAVAMIALRLGRADEALPMFQQVAPRADGMHLFGHALALLQSSRPDAVEAALPLLEQLVRDYPSSSAARNAGSFATQLRPR
jgi:hypothetical protein